MKTQMADREPAALTPLSNKQGVASLFMGLPGLILVGLYASNAFLLHSRPMDLWLMGLSASVGIGVLLFMPLVGVVVGLCGRASVWGRWGTATSGLLLALDIVYSVCLMNADI